MRPKLSLLSLDVAQAETAIAGTMNRLLCLRRRMQDGNFRHPGRLAPAMADRGMLEKHLTLAEEQVTIAEKQIVRQRELVRKLTYGGYPSGQAKTLLAQFEDLYSLHVVDRDSLFRELSELRAR
jgi:hypothetical protein